MSAIHKHLGIALALLALLLHPISAQTSSDGARKFDEFGDAQLSDIAARLDNFAIALQAAPQAKAFLIVYRSRRDLPGLSSSLVAWLKNYLVANRGFAAERVVAIDGGVAGRVSQELWLVPPGTTPRPRTDAYVNRLVESDSPQKFYEAIYYAPDFEPESYSFDISNSYEGFSEALRQEPESFAYLIAYAGYRTEEWGEYDKQGRPIRGGRRLLIGSTSVARRQLEKSKTILVKDYKVAASRIKVMFGGYREAPMMELWIAPRGQHAPIPTPNRFPKRIDDPGK